MRETVDYIKFHGVISSIRNNVDKDYVWFDICQKEPYKDKNGIEDLKKALLSDDE